MSHDYDDEDEEIIDYCDVCGVPLTEEDRYTVRNFAGEGLDGHFCYYHYEQMGYASDYVWHDEEDDD